MFKFPFRIRIAPKKILGIDIGASSIRVVELQKKAPANKLENYGDISWPFSLEKANKTVVRDIFSLSNQEIAEIIDLILKEAGILTRRVNFSLPDFSTFFLTLDLPPMSEKELPQAVRYEARSYIPLPFSEIVLDWTVVGGNVSSKAKSPLKVLVIAIPNETIHQYQQIASLANLKVNLLEAETFSLARALIKDTQEIIGLIDIGFRSTTCNIFEKGVLKISHSFNVAGRELTEACQRSLALDYQEAEQLKKNQGLVTIDVARSNLRPILLPLVNVILVEIKQVFQNFYQSEGKEIEKVILAGGTALMPGLREYFSQELGKEVILADPFSALSYPPVLDDVLKEMGPSYGVAVGLALKGLEQ